MMVKGGKPMRRVWMTVICTIGVAICLSMFEFGGMAHHNDENRKQETDAQLAESIYDIHEGLLPPSQQASVTFAATGPLKDKALEASVSNDANAAKDDAKELEKLVYLTFDDGPSKHTPEVLDLLKEEGIQATFFVLGEQVLRYPDIVKRIVDEGHAIGNHTYNHQYKQLYSSFSEFADQIMKTDEAIYETTGIRTTLVRAPGGTYTNFDQGYFDAVAAAGYQVHDWNVDSGDSRRRGVPAAEIVATVQASRLVNTLNVLLHDGSGHEESVKALPAIIAYYKNKDYSFAPLSNEVKPIQFQVAKKLKWNRAAVTQKQQAVLVHYAEALDRGGKPADAVQARKNVGSAQPAEQTKGRAIKPVAALVLHQGVKRLELAPDEYRLVDGSIYMLLLQLANWKGGTASIHNDCGIIEVAMNGKAESSRSK